MLLPRLPIDMLLLLIISTLFVMIIASTIVAVSNWRRITHLQKSIDVIQNNFIEYLIRLEKPMKLAKEGRKQRGPIKIERNRRK